MDRVRHQKRIDRRKRHEHFITLFYNEVTGQELEEIGQIPEPALQVLCHLDYHDLVKPFIAQDIGYGMSREQAAIKYGVTQGFARSIGEQFGHLPRKKTV